MLISRVLSSAATKLFEYLLLLIKKENVPPPNTARITHTKQKGVKKREMVIKSIDMAKCYCLQSERNIDGGRSIKRHFVLGYMCNVRSESACWKETCLGK